MRILQFLMIIFRNTLIASFPSILCLRFLAGKTDKIAELEADVLKFKGRAFEYRKFINIATLEK